MTTKVNYKAENCAYLDHYDGAKLSDADAGIKKHRTVVEMEGDALRKIIGESQWTFATDKLPVPKARIEWSLK